jgi:D-beta-D-heptose 7-phosphate kinase/D-beta-D-heptose 1-phosphate adenosyltransferase
MMRDRFAVVGHGRVGGAILSLLSEAGFRPAWVVEVNKSEANVPVYEKLPADPQGVDIVFITVPDDHISKITEEMAATWKNSIRNITVFHMSGMHTSSVLKPLSDLGAETACIHPLQSIMHPDSARKALKGSLFTVEGSPKAIKMAKKVADALGGSITKLAAEDKVIYHSAAVIASNYLTSVVSLAEELMGDIGLKREHILPLITGTISNIEVHGKAALTGPIRRGDWATIESHIRMLSEKYPDILGLYLALGRYTSRVAGRHWRGHVGNQAKIIDKERLAKKLGRMKERGYRVVFTNGCFDIIHAGHVQYLEQARNLGDCLVVGLNSDNSVRRLKGETRPINDQGSRAEVLAAFYAVDFVCVFDEDTPYNLIKTLMPDILVKGGDWSIDKIVGSDIVTASGGKVYSLPFRDGHSSTSIIEKMSSE